MKRLTKEQKYILLGIFLFAIFLLILLETPEHYESYKFDLSSLGDSSKNNSKNGFKETMILDFENGKSTKEDLKNNFTTKSFSGVNDGSICGDSSWSSKLAEFDPTCGNVRYKNEFENSESNLISVNNNKLVLKIGEPKNDDSEILNFLKDQKDSGNNVFPSIRLTSKNTFKNNQQHLFILKAKLPFGKALWPAWWLTGTTDGKQESLNTDWPRNGEIDIIELVNEEKNFKNVLHMCNKCKSRWKKGPKYGQSETKWGKTTECQGEYGGGCFSGEDYNGETVKANGNLFSLDDPSGIFACWWKPGIKEETIDDKKVKILGEIRFYYWKHDDQNLNSNTGPLSNNPNPNEWDNDMMTAVQYWKGEGKENVESCTNQDDEKDCHFNNMKMIFNTTVCGDWAGNTFPEGEQENKYPNCLKYITSSEGSAEIQKQKWEISYIAAFSKDLDNSN